MNINILINSLEELYKEADDVKNYASKDYWKEVSNRNDRSFKGLSLKEIEESKWNYTEGLDRLNKIESDLNLGGRKHIYKYDENDGDDLNFDRYLDGLPCLKKRIPSYGNKNGKYVKLHISICENCNISSYSMMIKAYTAMRIIDKLEAEGYRIQVSCFADIDYPGRAFINNDYKNIDILHIETVIKHFEDPLVKGQILTAISPWLFRHWYFKLLCANFKMFEGFGQAICIDRKETTSDIYINTGEALYKDDSEQTINRILKLFEVENN